MELNEKLAEWAGWTEDDIHWDKKFGVLPNFTKSLDACFKQLEPKLDYFTLVKHKEEKEYKASVQIDNTSSGIRYAETPALALCSAIEKLIDGEK